MTYFKDLSICGYFEPDYWLCRLIAVGWIEQGQPYPIGEVKAEVTAKIRELRQEFQEAFPAWHFRGLHQCSICTAAGDNGKAALDGSHVNLFIPHHGLVFVAPGRIDHHIEQHGYVPPESFIESVLECPSPRSESYREAMRAANRGYDCPLFDTPLTEQLLQ